DVTVDAKNLEALNTDVLQNNYYYGKAYVTGRASFVGPIETIRMTTNLSPDKNTKINIPFNTATEVSVSDFITFISGRLKSENERAEPIKELGGFSMVMNLDMNPNAEINLIFDEKIGDVITGNGSGSLKLELTEDGMFRMGGTFSIEKGTYLFTLQNIMNKRFNIDQGGTVTWVGDPYNARIDMSAVYTTSTASLVNLLQDSSFQRRVNVNCRLNLSGALMNPSISYDIGIQNQDATLESMVRTVLNSEQEINRQMFGLLVFNQFLPPSTSTASAARLDAGAGAVASASEMLSNQVSNWLSQLSNDVNIGFNYRAKDSYSNEEVRLMFSKTLFNSRLLVETNVGVTGNTVANASVSNSSNANSLVGEFFTEYKVSDDGRFRLKAYNRSNSDDLINFNAPYTQGFGLSFRQDFDNWYDLRQRMKRKEKKIMYLEPLPDDQQ
ncbi:MAG: translocation/assembly module TamB domain-containing protein, partial [Bacteroidota bacterium]